MSFLGLFPNKAIIDTLGDDVTYTALGGSPSSIKAIISYGVQQTWAIDAYVPERQVTIETLKIETPAIAKNDTFIHNSKTLTVDAVLDDDGYIIKSVVH